ncbi:MAG: DUF488 domain-containing protein [Xanthomonadales bacterium]|nr:DUF488 domain-containing protein [Xanthomonadales bacterium]
MNPEAPVIWTIGHSTRAADDFLVLLVANAIEAVADVRRHAGSRKHPQFNPSALAASLQRHGIEYVPMPELGGRRKPRADSHNTLWRNESFRGYADYMETPAFAAAIERLLVLARRKRTAMLCAEAVWWRCHRSLIADWLKTGGVEVRHILGPGKNEVHPWSSAAQLIDGRLSYAPRMDRLL